MKKSILLFLSLVMVLTLFSGCNDSSSGESTLAFSEKELSIKVGEKKELTVSLDGNAVEDPSALIWSSGNTDIAKVTEKGEVEAIGAGKTVITAKVKDNESDQAVCTVTVDGSAAQITELSFDDANVALEVGKTVKPGFSVKPEGASTDKLVWKSSNTAVATVENGEVKALSKGTAVIMTSTEDESISAACILNVSESGASTGTMLLDKNEVNLVSAATISSNSYAILTASFSPAELSDNDIVWVSSNEAVAKVSTKGVVVAISEGMAIITATSKKYDLSAICNVNVSADAVAVTSIAVYPSTMSLEVGGSNSAAIFIYPTNATNQSVVWSSSNILVATVDAGTGTITGISEGYALITATSADGLKTSYCTVTVSGKSGGTTGAITFDKTSIELKNGSQGVVTVSPSGTAVTWKSSNINVVAVDSSGILTATGIGQATITATSSDGSSTATCVVNVSAATTPANPSTTHITSTSINLSTNSKTLKAGDSFSLVASVLPSNATYNTVAWSSSDGNVASVENGVIKALSAGTTTITATNGEVSAKCVVTVEKAVVTAIESISLSETTKMVSADSSFTLNAILNPSDTNEGYSWSVDNSAIASIDASGTSCTVTAHVAGQVIITITSDSGKSASCTVFIQ